MKELEKKEVRRHASETERLETLRRRLREYYERMSEEPLSPGLEKLLNDIETIGDEDDDQER